MEEIQPIFDRNAWSVLFVNNPSQRKKFVPALLKWQNMIQIFVLNTQKDSVNALYYNIYVCPHCGFAYSKDFSKYFAPGTKEVIKEKICSNWVPHSFSEERTIDDAIQTYKLASYSATLKKEKHITLAGIYMRIAWLYRFKQDKEQEIRFMKLARHEYEESYSTGDYSGTQVSEIRILYLVGELSRRIGDNQQAMKYFSSFLKNKSLQSKHLLSKWLVIVGQKLKRHMAANQ